MILCDILRNRGSVFTNIDLFLTFGQLLKILIDTRERKPYKFETPSKTATLKTGDYSLSGAEHLVAIERKTIDDLVSSLTINRKRFERELFRGRAINYFALLLRQAYQIYQMADINRRCYQRQPSKVSWRSPLGITCPFSLLITENSVQE